MERRRLSMALVAGPSPGRNTIQHRAVRVESEAESSGHASDSDSSSCRRMDRFVSIEQVRSSFIVRGRYAAAYVRRRLFLAILGREARWSETPHDVGPPGRASRAC